MGLYSDLSNGSSYHDEDGTQILHLGQAQNYLRLRGEPFDEKSATALLNAHGWFYVYRFRGFIHSD